MTDLDAKYVIEALQEELARVNENRIYLLALLKQAQAPAERPDDKPDQ